MRLSIVLPAYQAAELVARHVPGLLAYLSEQHIESEVIVVDDGSDDAGATRRAAEALGCEYLRLPVNRGKGAAVRAGMLRARGAFRLFTDADVPYTFDAIDRFLWYLEKKEFHFVAGDRTLPGASYFAAIPLQRELASRVCSFVVGRFITTGWFDTQCGFKAFRAEVADDLFGVSRIERFAFDVELFYIALKRNYDIKRLPVRLRCQEGSGVRVIRDGLHVVRDLARMRYHQLAGHYAPRTSVHISIDSSPWKL